MSIVVRPVTRDELRATVEIYLECMREDYRFLPQPYLEGLTVETELAECEDWVYNQGLPVRVLAAFDGPLMAGYIAVGPNTGEPQGWEGEVNNLFVRRAYRGLGLGLRLLQAGLNYLTELGLRGVIIYNYRGSESNQFYRRLGGEVVYRTVQHPGGAPQDVDVFGWQIEKLLEIVTSMLAKRDSPAR